MNRNANYLFLATLLLLLMAAINITGLNDQGLWGDEGWSVNFADGSPRQVVYAVMEDRHPPLYFLMLRGWRALADDNLVSLRMLTVFHTLLTGAVLYQFGKLLFNHRAGLFALLIFTLMDQQVVWTQEVRHYPLLMLFTVMSGWLLLRMLNSQGDENKNRREHRERGEVGESYTAPAINGDSSQAIIGISNQAGAQLHPPTGTGLTSPPSPLFAHREGEDAQSPLSRLRRGDLGVRLFLGLSLQFFYTLTLIAGLYTHSFMLIVMALQAIFVVIRLRSIRLLIFPYMAAMLAFAPWGLVFIYQFTQEGGLRHDAPLTWATVEIFTHNFLGMPAALFLGLLIMGVLSPVIKAPVWKVKHPAASSILFSAWSIVFPIALIVALTLANDNLKLLTDRNLAIILPFLAVLIGIGVTAFHKFTQVALVAFLLVNGLFTTDAYNDKPPWREMAEYVAARQVDDQPIVLDVFGEYAALGYHVTQALDEDVPQVAVNEILLDPDQEIYATLRFGVLEQTDGLWYMVWGDGEDRYFDSFEGWGFVRTATATDDHVGNTLYMYRYDSVEVLNETLTTFGNQVVLHRVAVTPDARVHLWWRVPESITTDYTVSVVIFNEAGEIVSQHDSFPQENTSPMSTWQPNQLIFDSHPVDLPPHYRIGIRVYNWLDGTILETSDGQDIFTLDSRIF